MHRGGVDTGSLHSAPHSGKDRNKRMVEMSVVPGPSTGSRFLFIGLGLLTRLAWHRTKCVFLFRVSVRSYLDLTLGKSREIKANPTTKANTNDKFLPILRFRIRWILVLRYIRPETPWERQTEMSEGRFFDFPAWRNQTGWFNVVRRQGDGHEPNQSPFNFQSFFSSFLVSRANVNSLFVLFCCFSLRSSHACVLSQPVNQLFFFAMNRFTLIGIDTVL